MLLDAKPGLRPLERLCVSLSDAWRVLCFGGAVTKAPGARFLQSSTGVSTYRSRLCFSKQPLWRAAHSAARLMALLCPRARREATRRQPPVTQPAAVSHQTLMPPLRVSQRLRRRIGSTVEGKTLSTGLGNVLDQQWHRAPPRAGEDCRDRAGAFGHVPLRGGRRPCAGTSSPLPSRVSDAHP